MKKLILILIFSIFSYASIPTNSVVKIFSTISKPNYKEPWENPTISNMTGSGAIIRDNQILTAAHVVSGGKFIEVQKENDSKKYEAVVKYISNQADLAILDIKDKNFFSNTNALELSEEVKYQDSITAIGYPVGGNSVSSTNGIISRMEYKKYAWSSSGNLAIQIDAAINPGNSGGPVMNKDNKIVGGVGMVEDITTEYNQQKETLEYIKKLHLFKYKCNFFTFCI